jgi:hypothetical protein
MMKNHKTLLSLIATTAFVTGAEQPFWKDCVYRPVISGAAASVSIIPVFHGFILKSDAQNWVTAIRPYRESLQAQPKVATVVGTTIATQNMACALAERAGCTPVVASIIAAGASAPLYAIFNGQSAKLSMWESMRRMTRWQTMHIIGRETAFFYSLYASIPAAVYMKQYWGDQWWVESSTHLFVGGMGAVAGHPFDCALTYQQNYSGLKIEIAKHGVMRACTRGLMWRAGATAVFNWEYQWLKKRMTQMSDLPV